MREKAARVLKAKFASSGAAVSIETQRYLSKSTTVDNVASQAQYSPFDSDFYGGGYADEDHVTASGITFEGTTGRFTSTAAGVYCAEIALGMHVIPGLSDTVETIADYNGTTAWGGNTHVSLHNALDPVIFNIPLIWDPGAGEYIVHLLDQQGISSLNVMDGTTMTITEVPDITGSPVVNLCCVRLTSNSNFFTTEFSVFDEDNHTSFGSETLVDTVGIVFDSTDGSFAAPETAKYLVSVLLVIEENASNETLQVIVKIDGVAAWNTGADGRGVHNSDDPLTVRTPLVLSLTAGEKVTVHIVPLSATQGHRASIGTTMTIVQVTE